MSIELSIGLIFIFILVYAFLINFFTILFRLTGLTPEKARFQSISLLTTAGFTTTESEVITKNPARRKIAIAAMLTGTSLSVVIISLVINLFTNISPDKASSSLKVVLIIVGVFIAIIILFKLPFIKKYMDKLLTHVAALFLPKNKKENVITLLDVYNDKDAIAEVYINDLPEALSDKSLAECDLKNNFNITLLLVKRGKRVLDVTRNTIIQKNDSIVIFGPQEDIYRLFTQNTSVKSTKKQENSCKSINNVSLIDNYGNDAMAEIEINVVPYFLLGKKLYSSGLKENYNINILTIKRDEYVIKVERDTMIERGDVIVVFGNYKSIKDVFFYNI